MPATPTPMPAALYGREPDLAALAALLDVHRLVSIVGPGGVGKTALADALASEANQRLGRAACRLDLAPLSAGQPLLPALISALKVSVGAQSPLDAVVGALSKGPRLLVLDNCEHVLASVVALLGQLLPALPDLHCLQTSQEALNLRTEQVYKLGPLEVPRPDAALDVAQAAGAVALLVGRARAADPQFQLSAGNRAAVIDICRQLGGLPLAIELAAARLRTLGVDDLRARLGSRLKLLTAGPRDLPARHRTLRAALEWSHALLTPTEQVVFRRLGVMSGSFDIAAAQRVAADGRLDPWEVLDALHGLVGKSMLASQGGAKGAARFHLLETMHQFALELLQRSGEETATRDRHLAHFLVLAETAGKQLAGPAQGEWLTRLDQDRDNLYAAHRSCDLLPGGTEHGLRLATALVRYWLNRALLQGQQVVDEAIARPRADTHGALHAAALVASARLYSFRACDREAAARYRRAIEVARACDALPVMVESLARLGYSLIGLDDRAGARAALEEARALSLELPGDEGGLHKIASSNLAELERLEGNFAAAAPLYEEALAVDLVRGDRQGTMIALNNLAMMALALAEPKTARQRLLESLEICDELDSRRGRLVVMEVSAGLAADLGQWARAVFFDASARHHTLAMGRRRDVVDEAFLAPRLDSARRSLGADLGATEADRATQVAYDAAVGEMREWLQAALPLCEAAAVATAPPGPTVTAREREVASMVARGLENADIARLLGISVFTVRTHRQRLMDKLELRNAAEITVHAVRMGWFNPN